MRKKSREKKVYFTEEEWAYISKCAEESGMKVGTYIQTMAVHGQVIKCDFNNNKVSQQLLEIHTDLNRIGNNINQVAHKVNTTNKVYQADMNMMQKQFDKFKEHYILLLHEVQDYIAVFTDLIKEISKKRV